MSIASESKLAGGVAREEESILSSLQHLKVRAKLMFLISPSLLFLAMIVLFFEHSSGNVYIIIEDLFIRVLKEGTPYALLAIGSGLVLSTGGVDISIAGLATASGVAFASLTQLHCSFFIAGMLSVSLGLLSGLLLGQLVHKNAPALLMSWAFGTIWLIAAVAFAASDIVKGTSANVRLGVATSSNFWQFSGSGLRISAFVLLAVPIALGFSNLPRRACAVGANRDSAIYAGIRTGRVLRRCYAINGGLAALAGIFSALLTNGASTTDQMGRELTAIAIAVLGGTVMSGGYLYIPSILASALFWVAASTIVNGLDLTIFKDKQQYIVNALFAFIFIVIVAPLGRHLSAETRTIHTEQKAREE